MALTQRMPSAPQANRLAWTLAVALATVVLGAVGLLVFQRVSLSRRQQALEDAIGKVQVGQVRSLLDHGAGVNTPSRDGITPLEDAIVSGRGAASTDITALLLTHGARLLPRDLSLAAIWSNAETVKLLLAHGAKVDTLDVGSTPLIDAAVWGHNHPGTKAIIEALLAAGADPNAHTRNSGSGMTALMWAARNGQTAIVQSLIAHGADVNARSNQGWTALMFAAHQGQTATAQSLIVHGAAINARSGDGRTALMVAASYGRTSAVKLLLANGADLTPRESRQGRTALGLARKYGRTAVVQLLQQREAKG